MKNKKIVGLAAVLLLQGVYATSPKIWMNGKIIESDALPVIEENRALVPIRVISENLGLKVLWNGEEKTVKIQDNNDKTILLTIGKKQVKKLNDDKKIDIDVAPKIINNRTYVPIRFIGEAFDLKVDWDDKDKTVVIGEGYNKENKDDKDVTAASIVEALEKDGVKFYDKKIEEYKHPDGVEIIRLYTLENDKSNDETIGIYEFKNEEAAKKLYDSLIEKYTKTNLKELAEGLYRLKGKYVIALTINDKAKVNDTVREIIENM